MQPDERPYLCWEDLEPGATFRPFTLETTSTVIDDYVAVLGVDHELYRRYVPPGLAGVLGRRSYLEDHRMPPGGVLLKQSVRWLRPAALGVPIEARARVTAREERDGRRKVVVETRARQDGDEVATVEMTLGWPS